MCAATGSRLDLIKPLFELDDKKMKRAGLDYWHLLDVNSYDTFEDWLKEHKKIPWLVEVGSKRAPSSASFEKTDALMFGDEQDGIPELLLGENPERHLTLPQQGVRSLNLAMTVGIVTYEALRQLDWYSISTDK